METGCDSFGQLFLVFCIVPIRILFRAFNEETQPLQSLSTLPAYQLPHVGARFFFFLTRCHGLQVHTPMISIFRLLGGLGAESTTLRLRKGKEG